MKIDYLTLFPEMYEGFLTTSIISRAIERDLVQVDCLNFRKHGLGKHHVVDDTPYGGGAGMLLKPEPLYDAVEEVLEGRISQPRIIMMDPIGQVFDQTLAEDLSKEEELIFICGHYEGFDERIRSLATDHISIGDFVLTGGELASMVITDAVVRLLPEVLGNMGSAHEDSFSTQLLEHPHYTRPAEFRGMTVPDVLMSGNHQKIQEWRDKESLRRTYLHRPDLLDHLELTDQQKEWLEEFQDN